MNKKIVLLLLGTIILAFSGFNNKYPLLTAKSGNYIESGFERTISKDGSILYGLFVAHTSWGYSLWLTILTQSLFVSIMLFYFFKYFTNRTNILPYYLTCIFLSAFAMSASISSSSIQPGVFGAISILGFGLLLFSKELFRRDFWIIFFTVIVGLGMEPAYIMTLVFVLSFYAILLMFPHKSSRLLLNLNWEKAALGLFVIGSSLAVLGSVHLLTHSEVGIIKQEQNSAYKSNILKCAFKNIIQLDLDPKLNVNDITETKTILFKRYNQEIREVYLSRQMGNWTNYYPFDYLNKACIVLCIMFSLWIMKKGHQQYGLFFFILLANLFYALSNAIIYKDNLVSQHHLTWLFLIPILLSISNTNFSYPKNITTNYNDEKSH